MRHLAQECRISQRSSGKTGNLVWMGGTVSSFAYGNRSLHKLLCSRHKFLIAYGTPVFSKTGVLDSGIPLCFLGVMKLPARPFYMIRHGETDYNMARRMTGQIDAVLTERGKQQAQEARRIVEALEIAPRFVVHSALVRTRDTASIINTALNLPVDYTSDLNEHHFGLWQGMPTPEIRALRAQGHEPPEGETDAEFTARVLSGIAFALARAEEPVLIVSHGGVFSGFLRHFGLSMGVVENCHVFGFTPAPNGIFPWTVRRHVIHGKEVATSPVLLQKIEAAGSRLSAATPEL